jgi:hypothetical protein
MFFEDVFTIRFPVNGRGCAARVGIRIMGIGKKPRNRKTTDETGIVTE